MDEAELKEVRHQLENLVLGIADLQAHPKFWRLLSAEHRRQFEEFAALVHSCRRSLPGPVFVPPP